LRFGLATAAIWSDDAGEGEIKSFAVSLTCSLALAYAALLLARRRPWEGVVV
jgi:hypothetical protein